MFIRKRDTLTFKWDVYTLNIQRVLKEINENINVTNNII